MTDRKENLSDAQRKERRRAINRKYYLTHLEQKREYTRANRRKKARYDKKYRAENHDKLIAYNRHYNDTVRKEARKSKHDKREYEP